MGVVVAGPLRGHLGSGVCTRVMTKAPVSVAGWHGMALIGTTRGVASAKFPRIPGASVMMVGQVDEPRRSNARVGNCALTRSAKKRKEVGVLNDQPYLKSH